MVDFAGLITNAYLQEFIIKQGRALDNYYYYYDHGMPSEGISHVNKDLLTRINCNPYVCMYVRKPVLTYSMYVIVITWA